MKKDFKIGNINIGDKQNNRAKLKSVFNCVYDSSLIFRLLKKYKDKKAYKTQFYFILFLFKPQSSHFS